jgi:hypothetical protein
MEVSVKEEGGGGGLAKPKKSRSFYRFEKVREKMSQAPHYIILYYYLLLLSFITQPNPTKPISNTTKHNQT